MHNMDVAAAFYEIADLLEFKGDDPFKVRAYRKAAEAVELLPEEVAVLAQEGRLKRVPGIGQATSEKIIELLTSGQIAYLEELRRAVPPGVRELTRVPGLGARTAYLLYTRLGIDSLDRLELAARQEELRDLPGLGPRKEAMLLQNLRKMRTLTERLPLAPATQIADALLGFLRGHPAVARADSAGAIRRHRDTIADIDIVIATADPAAVFAAVRSLSIAGEAVREEAAHLILETTLGRRIDLMAVEQAGYARALLIATGSAEHLAQLGEIPAGATEEAIYAALGLDFIPPELREGLGEIEAARQGRLPQLLTVADLKGDLHTHTRASDGTATLIEMVEAARALGHQYLAICDHSQSLTVAGGLTPEQVRAQGEEIWRLDRSLNGFRILRGTEVDILKDGALDLPDDLLAELDVVVASIHSHMHLDREAQTERLIRAIRNPHVDIIGHPTGRVLGKREPYDLDFDRIVEACRETDTALEISASPARLDLSDLHARLARRQGVKLVINTDAHSTHELGLLPHGVGQARRAWVGAADVVNAMDTDTLLAWLAKEKR